jgi:hypothetical protein
MTNSNGNNKLEKMLQVRKEEHSKKFEKITIEKTEKMEKFGCWTTKIY